MLVRISCSFSGHYGLMPRSPLPRMLRCARYVDSSSIPGLIERSSVPRESQSSSLLPKGVVATPSLTPRWWRRQPRTNKNAGKAPDFCKWPSWRDTYRNGV